jgi:DNA polymerase-3 subunit delta
MTATYLVKGSDEALVAQALHELVGRLVGKRDPAYVVEEIDPEGAADALATPPFVTDRRVLVVRDAGRMAAAARRRLVQALEHQAPGTFLVLASTGGTSQAPLERELEGRAELIDAEAARGQRRRRWIAERLRRHGLSPDAAAVALLEEHLGEDLGRLEGLARELAGAYGNGRVGEAELEPFLGAPGRVAPFALTDAIDSGDVGASLRTLHRLLDDGGLQVLAVLHRHYEDMLVLDGTGTSNPADAARLLGKSPFVAGKALAALTRIGHRGLVRAFELLANADLDLRGTTALPPAAVLEVLVGRLAQLAPRPAATRRRRG